MRAVLQRVSSARVTVDADVISQIGPGLLAYVSIAHTDTEKDCAYLSKKILDLRIFSNHQEKFNLDLRQTAGQVMLISNFTLHADARKGTRPSFSAAAKPDQAKTLIEKLAQQIRQQGLTVAEGQFAAHMHIDSTNDGPVNILLDSAKTF